MSGDLSLKIALVRLDLNAAVEAQDGAAALVAVAALLELAKRVPELLQLDETAAHSPVAPTAKQLTSRYSGACSVCTERYRQGDLIYWDTETRKVTCARCSVGEYFGVAK